jgi:hypothetical protein
MLSAAPVLSEAEGKQCHKLVISNRYPFNGLENGQGNLPGLFVVVGLFLVKTGRFCVEPFTDTPRNIHQINLCPT